MQGLPRETIYEKEPPKEKEALTEENKLYESQLEDLTLEKLQTLMPIWRRSDLKRGKKVARKRKDKKYLVYREDNVLRRDPLKRQKG